MIKKLHHMHTQITPRLLAILAGVIFLPTAVVASSWSPTLLVNTEAFQSIDQGDGNTNIELRFGNTGSGLILNKTANQFEFDSSLEIQGTASGKRIHAQDLLTASGQLVVDGLSQFNEDVTIGSGITINGVKYIFPRGDGSATGKVLKTNGAGTLSWSDDNGGTSFKASQGLSLSASNFFSLNSVLTGTSLEIFGTASGRIVHAQNNLTSSGGLQVMGNTTLVGDLHIGGGNINFGASTTIGDGGDRLTIDSDGTLVINDGIIDLSAQTVDITLNSAADSLNFDSNTLSIDASANRVGIGLIAPKTALAVLGTISGSFLKADTALSSSGTLAIEGNSFFGGNVTIAGITSCTLLTTDSNGQLACDAEGFNESVDDRLNTLFMAGSGILLSYDDGNNKLTINQTASSGAQLSLSPEYAGAVYYGSGSNNVGQMVLAYDSTNKENYYKWTSTLSSLQSYAIAVRVKVPDEFKHWDGSVPIQLRYRTNTASANDNQIDVAMIDTAGSAVTLTGGTDLVNQSWTTATITGPQSAGTYTPGSYITIIITPVARTTNSGEAHVGFLNINWMTRER